MVCVQTGRYHTANITKTSSSNQHNNWIYCDNPVHVPVNSFPVNRGLILAKRVNIAVLVDVGPVRSIVSPR